VKALKDINLKIYRSEFIGVMGATGSGKSTLMQVLNGILPIQEGKIYFENQEIKNKDLKKLRRKIGLLFQFSEHQLFAETVEKDVAFGPQNQGIAGAELCKLVQESLEAVGLSYLKYKDRSPFSLSGGEQRRVALAGVLALNPQILILDEPTVGLDSQGKKELLSLLKEMHQKGITVIMVSHKIDELIKLATRLLVLKEGKIVLDGPVAEVMKQKESLHKMGLELPLGQKILKMLKEKNENVRDDFYLMQDVEKEIVRCARSGILCSKD
jgi:energy-coupling factor transport system ATP-binding protein